MKSKKCLELSAPALSISEKTHFIFKIWFEMKNFLYLCLRLRFTCFCC
jgi:hypothetical protein